MKANIYYIFLVFLLIIGGNYLFANRYQGASSSSFYKNGVKLQQVKHKKSNHQSTINVVIYVDFEEEFPSNENHQDRDSNNVLANTKGFLNNWYLSFSDSFLFKNYCNNFKNSAPFSVHSNPIYLIIEDFRI
jgi:predicted alpha/beta superfamily hydrolase